MTPVPQLLQDLTALQRDALAVIASLGEPHGLAAKTGLGAHAAWYGGKA